MTVISCPTATVRAPIALVWSMLSDPVAYETWADAELVSIDPAGPAQAAR